MPYGESSGPAALPSYAVNRSGSGSLSSESSASAMESFVGS